MSENKLNADIHPQLENILKDELSNRAKKLQRMKEWEAEAKSRRKHQLTFSAAISSIAAIFIVGFFFFSNQAEDSQVFRGHMVDVEIYEQIEAGNTSEAVSMIDSCYNECKGELQALQALEITPENKHEIEDRINMINEELEELQKLKSSLRIN